MRYIGIEKYDTHIHGVSEFGREDHCPANAVASDNDMANDTMVISELQQRCVESSENLGKS